MQNTIITKCIAIKFTVKLIFRILRCFDRWYRASKRSFLAVSILCSYPKFIRTICLQPLLVFSRTQKQGQTSTITGSVSLQTGFYEFTNWLTATSNITKYGKRDS